MNTVLQTKNLSKSYQGFQAVQDVSLKIEKGEIYGFIGLNGAGKTTVIRMLLGLIRPSEGTSYLQGEKVHLKHHHLWEKVGYLVETPHFYPELTVQENLEVYKKLRLLSHPDAVTNVMAQLHLTKYAQVKAGNLSLGNAQRLGIAKALLPQPEILILDEPVNGLDPAGIIEIRKLLQKLAQDQGVTILISSHLLSEIAKIATKIGIIHQGKLIQEFESQELKQLLHQRLVIDTRHNQSALSKLSAAGYSPHLNKTGSIEIRESVAVQHPENISRLLVDVGFPPAQITIEEEDLESYFLEVIKNEEGD